jgi:hypothetical protein
VLPNKDSMTAPAGKTFAGWTANGQNYAVDGSYPVTGDITFTARWIESANALTVSFSAGGGSGTVPASKTVTSGDSITLPNEGSMTAPAGQVFDGWTANGQNYAVGGSYPVTGDITFTARWIDSSAPSYTASFSFGTGSGTVPDSQTVLSGKSITLPNQGSMTAPSGKTFDGWNTGGQNYAAGASYTVTGNVTFTAQWVSNAAAETEIIVHNKNEWEAAINTIKNGENNKSYVITVDEDITGINGTIGGTFRGVYNITVTLRGTGSLALSPTAAGSLIFIGDTGLNTQNQILILEGLTLKGRAGNQNAVVRVQGSGAVFSMQSGTITGNTSHYTGGGVEVGVNGTLTMSGGTISGNSAINNNGSGGGVSVAGGTFTMSGGTISGNSAIDSYGYGGGVYVTPGIFNMDDIDGIFTKTGGTVYGKDGGDDSNQAYSDTRGHAVYIYGGKYRDTTAGSGDNIDSSTGAGLLP